MFRKCRKRWFLRYSRQKNNSAEAGITEFLTSAELVALSLRLSPTGSTLVASQAVRVAVLKRHLEITAIEFAVAESRVVILRRVPVRTVVPKVVAVAIASTTIPIVTALFGAFVVSGVQCRLAQLVIAAPGWVTVAATSAAAPTPTIESALILVATTIPLSVLVPAPSILLIAAILFRLLSPVLLILLSPVTIILIRIPRLSRRY